MLADFRQRLGFYTESKKHLFFTCCHSLLTYCRSLLACCLFAITHCLFISTYFQIGITPCFCGSKWTNYAYCKLVPFLAVYKFHAAVFCHYAWDA